MISVKQAVIQLKQAKVISNEEVLRRWLREGKVEGAYIESKKQGWQIPEDTILAIIATKEEQSSNKEYNKGYQEGYAAAQAERKSKMRELVVKGGYDQQFSIYRQDFRELAPIKTKEYLKFTDDKFSK
ncbi:hypothetical protein PSG83_08990 [Enterococcus faecium]|uniref:hypothetical protein n=1 Tax=Enterococcus faecium TaxID=1352 RepID=UPI0029529C2E|nr:hypothetical protein [Enterococcus faecium]EMF0319037.1 hypothetical protein [Enterococcus faecium]MDV7729824.1 hypothetical protein [Enterococcus faecium]MDV7859433.1 hypothetical protein [Enterococcus faecium]